MRQLKRVNESKASEALILGVENNVDLNKVESDVNDALIVMKNEADNKSKIPLKIKASINFGQIRFYFYLDKVDSLGVDENEFSLEQLKRWPIASVLTEVGSSTLYIESILGEQMEKDRFLKSTSIRVCAKDIAIFIIKKLNKEIAPYCSNLK